MDNKDLFSNFLNKLDDKMDFLAEFAINVLGRGAGKEFSRLIEYCN